MKRKDRARQTKRRIMDRALAEFSVQGYRGASVNKRSWNGGGPWSR